MKNSYAVLVGERLYLLISISHAWRGMRPSPLRLLVTCDAKQQKHMMQKLREDYRLAWLRDKIYFMRFIAGPKDNNQFFSWIINFRRISMVYDIQQHTIYNTLVKQRTRRGHLTDQAAAGCDGPVQVTQVTRTTTSLLPILLRFPTLYSQKVLTISSLRYSHEKFCWFNLSWLSIYFLLVFSIQHHNTCNAHASITTTSFDEYIIH